jgi:hypothetical protein
VLAIEAPERARSVAAGRQRQDQERPALGTGWSFRLAHVAILPPTKTLVNFKKKNWPPQAICSKGNRRTAGSMAGCQSCHLSPERHVPTRAAPAPSSPRWGRLSPPPAVRLIEAHMTYPTILQRIRLLIPEEMDGHYKAIVCGFEEGDLTAPSLSISDMQLARAVSEFTSYPPNEASIATLERRLNPQY